MCDVEFDSLVFYEARLDISCEKAKKIVFEEEEVVSFLRQHITHSRALAHVVNVFYVYLFI
jgi:hypothetical protein